MRRYGLVVNIALADLAHYHVDLLFLSHRSASGACKYELERCVVGSHDVFGLVWYFAYQRHRFTGPKVIVGSMDVQ